MKKVGAEKISIIVKIIKIFYLNFFFVKALETSILDALRHSYLYCIIHTILVCRICFIINKLFSRVWKAIGAMCGCVTWGKRGIIHRNQLTRTTFHYCLLFGKRLILDILLFSYKSTSLFCYSAFMTSMIPFGLHFAVITCTLHH